MEIACTDEVKVYKDEGEEDEQKKLSENLTEDKVGLVIEGEGQIDVKHRLIRLSHRAEIFDRVNLIKWIIIIIITAMSLTKGTVARAVAHLNSDVEYHRRKHQYEDQQRLKKTKWKN
ncbi:uncharacterized protein DEA37_0001599 [Paragonimus westermani]|uniref:Uncharacterized protein n=1 Tax=Paragonimus westermani TaxID=34504 RepID=A0A5J4N692_9TREM|nr:uncharacterized protein DEA37_0001599 [Paragonimus westermani]